MKKLNNASVSDSKKRSIIIFISALIVFMIFPLLTEIFATELREISAIISEKIIGITGIYITRDGTILSLKNMAFDIIPACDGSAILRILFTLSIFLACFKKDMTIPKKTISLFLSIPVALFSNGIRVSMLILISSLKGYAITEGFLHSMIGIFCFILATLAMIAILDFLTPKVPSSTQKKESIQTCEILILSLIMLFLVHSTFIFSCLKNWKGTAYNINDMYGYIFFIPGALLYIIGWLKHKSDTSSSTLGYILFSITILIAFSSQLIGNNNYLLGCTFLITIVILGLIEKGWHFALKTIPLLMIIFLSYPKTTEFINDIIGIRGINKALIIKLIIALILLIIYWLFYKKISTEKTVKNKKNIPHSYKLAWMIILLTGIVIAKSYDLESTSKNIAPSKISLNYIMKDWIGTDIVDNRVEKFYGNWPILNRSYTNGTSAVGLLVVSSKGNRKNIHTPEYCQYPLGWRVKDKTYYTFTTSKGYEITANHLLLKNGERYRNFLYWFDNGDDTNATYYGFILNDIFQKFLGNKTNWYLYVVWSDNNFNDIKSFLNDFSR